MMDQQGENSPPIHVMNQKGENVPYSIPSANFARSQSTKLDWSSSSSDSLFSIRVENQSLSEDQIVNENPGENFKSGELITLNPSVVAPGVDCNASVVALGVDSNASVVTDDCTKDRPGSSNDEPIQERSTHSSVSCNPATFSNHSNDTATISNHSDDSETNGCTFFFPIRKKKRKEKKEKKCSCFSNCHWAFCYCTWQSCCCCSNCNWASCYCWNCSAKRWCCNLFTDRKNACGEEKKVVQKQQEEQSLASAVASKSARCSCSNCNWASCYNWNCSIKRWCCNFSTTFTERRKVCGQEKKVVQKQQEEQSHARAVPSSKSACCSCCARFSLRRYWRWCCSCKCCQGN